MFAAIFGGAMRRAEREAAERSRARSAGIENLRGQLKTAIEQRDAARSALTPFAEFAPCFCNCNRSFEFVGRTSDGRVILNRADFDIAYQAVGKDIDALNAQRDITCGKRRT